MLYSKALLFICFINSVYMLIPVHFSHSVVSDSLWPHRLHHARLPCPSPTPGAYSNSYPSSCWCCPTISSVIPSSSCFQSFPASGSFQMSQKSIARTNIQYIWFPLNLWWLIGIVCGWLGAWTRCSARPAEVRPCFSGMESVDEPWVGPQSISAKRRSGEGRSQSYLLMF